MPSVLVGTEEGLGWREVKTGGCGHKPRDAGHWRLEEMGSTSIHLLRVEGVQSCTHLALDSGLRLSTLSSPPSENLTSGDTFKPQAALAEADGHGRVCPTPWGILASRIAEALQNLDPAQLPGPSEGPERTSVLRVGPRQGGG